MRSPWERRPDRARADAALRLLVRALSELCLTVGTVILLFTAYVLFWTGFEADRAMAGELDGLRDRWAREQSAAPGTGGSPRPAGGTSASPSAVPAPAAPGRAFAEMYVPRFGPTWRKPVLEGTAAGTLKRGLGHYSGTAPPGGTGNFAVAGHRRTHGDPFKDFPRLRPGDPVLVKDGRAVYTYVVRKGPVRTLPTDTAVVDPVPAKSGFTAPGRYLTLTTCDPEWGHSHRLIVWAELAETRPVGRTSP
ncbi:class E sortase [Streptomyces sp. NPDC097619]|uniref:class E sortase n=1 Tax=Streptomyces sp. NPDC097619 TaxID=3157228 RepID=UPI00331AD7E5